MSENQMQQTAEPAEEQMPAVEEAAAETQPEQDQVGQEQLSEEETGEDQEGEVAEEDRNAQPGRPSDDPEAGEDDSSEGESDEGDIAADYLEELLDIVDLDGDLDIEVRGDRSFISVVAEDGGDELTDLVGRQGEVLDALQELTRLAVLTATGSRTRLVLDIAGHREHRQRELKVQADDAIAQVREHGQDVHLEPMSSYERKIVHDFVADAELSSESEGEGKRRHVVVAPA